MHVNASPYSVSKKYIPLLCVIGKNWAGVQRRGTENRSVMGR